VGWAAFVAWAVTLGVAFWMFGHPDRGDEWGWKMFTLLSESGFVAVVLTVAYFVRVVSRP
jgi:hypothetical protein